MYNTVRIGDSLSSVDCRVAFVSRKNESETEIAAPKVRVRVQRLALFGPPLLLEGEDAAAYDQLLARICAAVKPVDVIDEMFVGGLAVAPLEMEFDSSARK
jgi:transcriptional regulator of aromatic amino acid metabolism